MDDEKPPLRPVPLHVSRETDAGFCCDRCAKDKADCDDSYPCGRCGGFGGLAAIECRDGIRTQIVSRSRMKRALIKKTGSPGEREVFLKGESPLFVPTTSPLEINFYFDCLELHYPLEALRQALKDPSKFQHIYQLAALFDTVRFPTLVSRIASTVAPTSTSTPLTDVPEKRIIPGVLQVSETSSFTPVERRGSFDSTMSFDRGFDPRSSSSTSLEDTALGEQLEGVSEQKSVLVTPKMMVHILSEEESENLLKFSPLNPSDLAKIISMLHSDIYATLAVFEKVTETSFDIMVAPNRFFHKLFDYSVEDLRYALSALPRKGFIFPMMNLMSRNYFLPIIRFWVEQHIFDYESFEGDVVIQDAHGQLTKVRVFMWGAPGLRVTSFLPLESIPTRSQKKI